MATKELELRQIREILAAIERMKSAGVSLKGLAIVDMGIIKHTLKPILEGYNEEVTANQNSLMKYNRALSMAQGSVSPEKSVALVIEEHQSTLDAYNKRIGELNALLKEKKTVDIPEVDIGSFTFDDKNGEAASVIGDLLPCIKR
jgi:hypothetical protein